MPCASGGYPDRNRYRAPQTLVDESLPSLPCLVYGALAATFRLHSPGGRWYLVNGSSRTAALGSGCSPLSRGHPPPASPPLVAARARGGAIHACAMVLRTIRAC